MKRMMSIAVMALLVIGMTGCKSMKSCCGEGGECCKQAEAAECCGTDGACCKTDDAGQDK
jgi:hypothetical protein